MKKMKPVSTNSKKFFILGSCLALLAGAYTNCSKIAVSEVQKASVPSNAVGLGTPDTNPPTSITPTPDAATLSASCAEAKATGRMRTAPATAKFPDPGKVCDWGVNGNHGILDGSIRARIEQAQSFNLASLTPDKAHICNITMTSTLVSQFRYDDNILMSLNGFLIASTSNFTRHLLSYGGLYKYDWSRLLDKPAQNAASDTTLAQQYCAGKNEGLSTCQFPETETLGTAQLKIGQSVIQNILGMTDSTKFDLVVVTTGDNDSTDCQHVPIDLNLDVEYFIE